MSSEVDKGSSTQRKEGESKRSKPILTRSVSQLAVAEAQHLVLWKKPLSTIYHLVQYMADNFVYLYSEIVRNKIFVFCGIIILIGSYFLDNIEGPHQALFDAVKKNGYWMSYWTFLGFLSSFGFGTGLHTFLLYLGPHIAHVTLAAWTCKSLDFPEPPYPDTIICPTQESAESVVSFWTIFNKVSVEAICWGAGTAIGELPPYFMARTARRSGENLEEEEQSSAKKKVQELVTRFGFFGILLCASIPNPLFDLAGITCGYFLIPFSTFFSATLVGKAGIKMAMQTSFIIIVFTESYLKMVIRLIAGIPKFGAILEPYITDYFEQQRIKLKLGQDSNDGGLVSFLLTCLVTGMIMYFVISTINSLAQQHLIQELKKQSKSESKKDK
ncbi:Vacuole membrane protein 1 [Oopsacas minuta]|uniref:Vacuole membrane protein 1 n=1 Tax=Oopsacas minuta TaxID=111878 RepID=A0AAV7JB35_9METZ|nr:Vacuole membrane protein 1 [Oopsacas minuta]